MKNRWDEKTWKEKEKRKLENRMQGRKKSDLIEEWKKEIKKRDEWGKFEER